MRDAAVLALVVGVFVYAQLNWFRAACIVLVYTAAREYPGVPDPIGMNAVTDWTVMLLGVTVGWMVERLRGPRRLPLPRAFLVVLGLYLTVETLAVVRLCAELETFREKASTVNEVYGKYDMRGVLVDFWLTPLRYIWLGVLFMDGTNTRGRLLTGVIGVVATVVFSALVINRHIPPHMLAEQGEDMRRMFQRWTNRHPNDLAREFAACFWLLVMVVRTSVLRWQWRVAAMCAAPLVLLGLAHSHSRGAYVGFFAAGLATIVALRWWKGLGVLALVGLSVVAFAPNIVERALTGLDLERGDVANVDELTAGRNVIWNAALEAFYDSPVFGYGAYGYVLSRGIDESVARGGGELHPHNAYLQTLLDHGLLLGIFRLLPFFFIAFASWRLVRRRSDPVLRLGGVIGLCWAVACLSMGLTGQHLGLTQNLFLFWAVAGVAMGASVMREVQERPLTPMQRERAARAERFDAHLEPYA